MKGCAAKRAGREGFATVGHSDAGVAAAVGHTDAIANELLVANRFSPTLDNRCLCALPFASGTTIALLER